MGGGGQQQSTSATEFSSETGPWSPQVPHILTGFDQARKLYEQGVPDYYPGGLTGNTGFSGQQNADLLAGNVRMGAGTPYSAMTDALTKDVTGNLQKNILPGIRQQQVMYQPGGSSRAALQQNQAVADAVQSGLTKPMAQMYSSAYDRAQQMRLPAAQQRIDQQQSAMGMYPSIMAAPLGMYGAIGEVGAQRRAMTQEAINRDMARYAYESGAPQNALQNYMSMITGNYGGTSSGGSSTTSNTPSQGSGIGNIIGSLGQAYIMSQSDIRVKENIVPEGTTWKGLSVYNYNYIGDERPRRGVMAQQVETMYPDAVTTIDGVKHVNYGAI